MLNLTPEKRGQLLTETIPAALKVSQDQTVIPYVVLAPASRGDLRGMLNTCFDVKEGLFPEDLSEELALDGVEPQLTVLTAETMPLLEQALTENNGSIIIYSPLSLTALAAQLRPLIEIVNQQNGQLEYLTWWESQVFPMLMRIMNPERLAAFMGNIHAVGLVENETPDTLQLYSIDRGTATLQHQLITEATIETLTTTPHRVLEHQPLPQLLHFNAQDLLAFKEYTVDKQIKQMTHLLASTELARAKSKVFDDLINDVSRAAKFAYKHYHLTQTTAQYAFIKASFALGGQFEQNDPSLLNTLQDKHESNSIKQVRIEKHLSTALANQPQG